MAELSEFGAASAALTHVKGHTAAKQVGVRLFLPKLDYFAANNVHADRISKYIQYLFIFNTV